MYLVICNAPPQDSRALARRLVTERAAACINIVEGVTSFYTWEGKFVEDEEDTLLIKVSDDALEALIERLDELHPYDVPEIVAVEPAQVSEAYADWVAKTCKTG